MNVRQSPETTKQLQALAEKLEEIPLAAREERQLARQIVEAARQLFPASVIALLKPSTAGRLSSMAVSGTSKLSAHHLDWLSAIFAEAANHKVRLVTDRSMRILNKSESLRPEGISSFAAVALQPDESQKPLAVLYLDCRSPRKPDFEEKKLKSFAEQTATLLQSARLMSLTDDLRQYRDNKIDTKKILQSLTEWIRETTEANPVVLFPFFQESQQFDESPYRSGNMKVPQDHRPAYYRADDIASLAAHHRRPVFTSDSRKLYGALGGNTRRKREGRFEKREGIKSTAALPLLVDKELIGVLFLNYRHKQTFTQTRKEWFLLIADFAAQIVKRSRKHGEVATRHVHELKQFREIDSEISKIQKLRPLLHQILKIARKYIPAAVDASIRLYDPISKMLVTEAADGPFHKLRFGHTLLLSNKDSIICLACQKKIPICVPDVTSREWKKRYRKIVEGMHSELAVPLWDGDELVGAINLESAQRDAFRQEDQNFLVALADRATLAIKNARIYERVELYREETEAILRADQKLVLKPLFDRLLAKALSITNSDNGAIWLYDERWDDLCLVAGKGAGPGAEGIRLNVSQNQGIVSWVMKNKAPLIVNVTEPEWQRLYEELIPGTTWQLSVPILQNRREARGVIAIERPSERAFTVDDMNLLEQMANLAEIALRLAERTKSQKRLKALHEVDVRIISQLANPDTLMWKILERALKLTEASQGDLHLCSAGKFHTTYYAAKKGRTIVARKKRDETKPDQQVRRGIVEYVALKKKSYRTRDDAQDDAFYVGVKHIHSEVAVPLLSRDELIGVLNLESGRRDDFTEDDVGLLELLAGQAVIAIQNAHNYKEAQEESKRFSILRNVGQRLNAITAIAGIKRAYNEAYSAVIKALDKFTGGWSTIRLFDKEKGELQCVAFGGPRKGRPPFKTLTIDEGANGLVAREWMAGRKRTIVINDLTNPPRGVDPKPASTEMRSLIVTPIFFEEQYYGNLFLTHNEIGFFEEEGVKDVGSFVDEDIKLLEGLAEQLGVTIHRLEAVRERLAAVEATQKAEQRVREAEIMTAWGQLNSGLAHSLGNNLGHIEESIDFIRGELAGKTPPAVDEELTEILASINKTLELNKQLRAYADKIKKDGSPAIPPQRVVLRELLDEVLKGMSYSLANIQIRFQWTADLADVNIVPQQIADCLFNIIQNAVEAMSGSGKLIFGARNQASYVELRISDTGNGIPIEDQAKIFELFYSTKDDSDKINAGLGLSNAKSYAVSNGGDLKVESKPGKGATFILLLPQA